MPEVFIPCTAKQREFLYRVIEDESSDVVIFGGARGGGKTFIDCLAMVLRRLMYPKTRGLMLRRTQSAADQNLKQEIEKVLYDCLKLPRGAVRYHVNDKIFTFPNGSTIKLGYCKLDSDYTSYMGTEYADIDFEELTQHEEDRWNLVGGSNRSNNPKCKAKRYASCNPGGIGHQWVKERYIDHPADGTHFIKALPEDNLALLVNDPGYVKRVLDPLPEWQRRQWKDGDWSAIAGAYFDWNPAQEKPTFDPRTDENPKDAIEVPYWADWVGGVDWGRTAPFCTLFLAKWQDSAGKNRVHVVQELYRAGLELDAQANEVTTRLDALTRSGLCASGSVRFYADPAIAKPLEGTSTETGRTIRSVWATHGFFPLPAHTNARVPGWQLVRLLMRHGILTIDPSCKALLKEIKGAVYEGATAGGEPTGEDIDSDCSDHALDSLRYCLVSTFRLDFTTNQANPYAPKAA